MTSSTKWLAILAILGTGLIHALLAGEAFGDATYKGVLFCLNAVAGLISAYGIYANRRTMGWTLGFIVAAGSIAAYIASRTVGLPGLPAEPENWLEPMGVASLVCEGLFVVLAIFAGPRTEPREVAR